MCQPRVAGNLACRRPFRPPHSIRDEFSGLQHRRMDVDEAEESRAKARGPLWGWLKPASLGRLAACCEWPKPPAGLKTRLQPRLAATQCAARKLSALSFQLSARGRSPFRPAWRALGQNRRGAQRSSGLVIQRRCGPTQFPRPPNLRGRLREFGDSSRPSSSSTARRNAEMSLGAAGTSPG